VFLCEQNIELYWLISFFSSERPTKKNTSRMEKNFHVDDLVHFIDNYPSGTVWLRGIKMDRFQTAGILENLMLKKKKKEKKDNSHLLGAFICEIITPLTSFYH